MKLESVALEGKDILDITPEIRGNTVDTTLLVYEMFNERNKQPVADLAFSAESYLANGLARLAMENAERLDVKTVGFSGGVAYNEHITQAIRKNVEKNGFRFVVHNMIPPGDGGIAFGQTIAASLIAQ